MERKGRAVLYSRCSTTESRQDVDVQTKELRRYADAFGFEYDLVEEYSSGYRGEQPKLKEIIEKIRRGYYSTFITFSLDRFSRQAPHRTNQLLDQIVYQHRCRFISISENLDSNSELVWCAIRPIFSYMANLFSRNLSERIKLGIQNKKAKGLYRGGGRPKDVDVARLKAIIADKGRLSLRALEREYNAGVTAKSKRISYQVVRKLLPTLL